MKEKKGLSRIKLYKPGKPIEELKREKKLTRIFKLASNEIPFYPDYAEKAIKKEIKNLNRYPESSCFYLGSKLAKKLEVSRDSIVFGNGSDEIISLALKAFIEKGDEVIVAFPSFLIYQIQAQLFGAKVVKVPLKNYAYDLDEIAKKAGSRTKIIFIANPDNPTGTYINRGKITKFLKEIPKDILLFFDEAYYEFAPSDFPDSLELLKKRKNLIITRTFSKAYGLAGLRIGYGVTSKEIAAALNKVREPFNVNRLAQVAAESALENENFVKKAVDFINQEKKYIYENLKKLDLSYIESSTNFVLFSFKPGAKRLYNYMLNRGVIIRELSGWGLDNFFRVTVGTRAQNREFIRLLANYKKSIYAGRKK